MSTVVARHRRDRGAADALGLVLIAPAMIGLALLVVALGRRIDGQAQSRSAAEFAAQAAALERSPSAAVMAAERTAAAILTDPDSCGSPRVTVDTADFRPGGSVSVTIECTASGRALGPVQPEGRSVRATAVARIDRFRAAEAAP